MAKVKLKELSKEERVALAKEEYEKQIRDLTDEEKLELIQEDYHNLMSKIEAKKARKMTILGEYIIGKMEADPDTKNRIMQELDPLITDNQDREIIGLEPIVKAKKSKSVQSDQSDQSEKNPKEEKKPDTSLPPVVVPVSDSVLDKKPDQINNPGEKKSEPAPVTESETAESIGEKIKNLQIQINNICGGDVFLGTLPSRFKNFLGVTGTQDLATRMVRIKNTQEGYARLAEALKILQEEEAEKKQSSQ